MVRFAFMMSLLSSSFEGVIAQPLKSGAPAPYPLMHMSKPKFSTNFETGWRVMPLRRKLHVRALTG